MSAPQRAALALHELQASDRDWVLSQLDVGQSQPLRAMLAELEALGIPRDAALSAGVPANDEPPLAAAAAADAVPCDPPQAPVVAAPVLESALDRVRRAPCEQALRVLQREPARLLAYLQVVECFAWFDALLQAIGPERRDAVAECLPATVAPRLAQALIEELDARLQALPPAEATGAAHPRVPLVAWLRRKVSSWT